MVNLYVNMSNLYICIVLAIGIYATRNLYLLLRD